MGDSLDLIESKDSNRRRFVFDHLWGIPGDTAESQLKILKQLTKQKVSLAFIFYSVGFNEV